jgi:nitrogen fixation-related uncharacterized protein
MSELIALVAGEFVVSVLMGLGALCLFLWAALSGHLRDVEAVKPIGRPAPESWSG